MNENKPIKNTGLKIEKFLEFRNGLSSEDKKLEAGVLIEEIKTINVDSAYHKVSSRIKTQSQTKRFITIITRVAAVLTLPLLAFTVWSLFFQEKPSELAQNETTWYEIESPAGMRSHVVLPDGTDLWLNAESKIKYGIPFTRENRQVELTGEAFLKVVKNENAPFIVNAGAASVKVLGTQFNVKAYPEDELLEVALTEGSVDFTGTTADGKKAAATLIPNDFLAMNKTTGQIKLQNKNLNKHISWVKNTIIFDETPMPEVAKTLERWYGVKVIVADAEITKYRFTTTFENESLFRVLELLELSSPDIKIKYTPGKINRQPNMASPSTVTINKK
ncbi:MAG TPA: FecR domain-containing protein, partial [Draconibacterium sp.]|nr:FecR domain-containing protein [Draconibacterium sp.]